MSSINTTHIDGDVSVSRNTAIGGDVTVQGKSQFKGNVKIEGWLEAKNIKGPAKGLYTTLEKLKIAYPLPHDGWWALVGTSLPAPIYVADGGEWVPTGQQGGNPTIDSGQYNEAVEKLQQDIEKIQDDIVEINTKDKSQDTNLTTLGNSVNDLQTKVNNAQSVANTANNTANEVNSQLDTFKKSKGQPDGIAPLNESGKISSQYLPGSVDDVKDFNGFVTGISTNQQSVSKSSTDEGCSVLFNKDTSCFVICVQDSTIDPLPKYYNNWLDADLFGSNTINGIKPVSDKVYNDTTTNKTYRWSGSSLVIIGSDLALGHTSETAFPGNEGVELQNRMTEAENQISEHEESLLFNKNQIVARGIINVNKIFGLAEKKITFSVALDRCDTSEFSDIIKIPGVVLTFLTDAGWVSKQWTNTTDWNTESNWKDFGSGGGGIGNIINVNDLCGGTEYTLKTAIQAILDLEKGSGASYFKSGIILTFKTAETGDNGTPIWLAYQFTREVSDINPDDEKPWVPFGSGNGSSIETADEPEEDGKDAFSTGGAYKNLPADLHVDTETEGVVKISMRNAKGDTIGDEHQFAIGTGGGGQTTGTIVTIVPEKSPLYAKAGGSIILRAAIRSVTTQSGQELTNIIEHVEMYDRDTNQLLETFRVNQASSSDNQTYDFSFDLSGYFPLASQRKFRFVAYDDSGNTGSRNINVTAVDVTIKSEQTLNYTSSTAINVGGTTKTLPMYRFPNNASDKGILCTVEIYINNEWKVLGTSTVSDTYSHSISVNPQNCAGSVLQHGAYPIRIHGEDIASGVTGNYLHTAIMVIDDDDNTPIIVTRWYSENMNAEIKQYETISMDFAVYSLSAAPVEVQVIERINEEENVKQTTIAYRTNTYTYTQRIGNVETDGSVTINLSVKASSIESQTASFQVVGTLLNIEPVTSQLMVDMDFANRSNNDADKTITYNGYELKVTGANYSTNGFVKDSYGTEDYGTENDPGVMALRIAENVKASLNYAPFNQAAMETNGQALQFRIRTKHVADDDARLISCISGGFGFYVTGKKVVFTTDNAETVAHTITSALKDDSITDVVIVIEPTSQAPYGGIGVVKMYFDGELIGACYYSSGSLIRHATNITFDGSQGDLYLYNIRAWETYYSFEQSFNNYLLKLADTDNMISEYDYNQVMASQSAEGKPATNRPQASLLYNIGIPYFVLCKNATTANTSDNYPDYLESLDGDKKTTRLLDVYAYFPDRPWQDFKAIGVTVSNQGTTSSMRPIKNIKMKFKNATITLLHDRSEFSGDDLLKYDECAANATNHRVQPLETSVPTNIITVKVDYSESGGANNGASTHLFNDLQRALGSNYMTPAQNAYTGKYVLNTSIDSVPCAFFRTDEHSSDATSPSYGYFHAKGNWNDDKGDAAVFGFEEVDGYNKGCLNYGDFIELIAAKDQTLEDFNSKTDKSGWDTGSVYVMSEFCGPNHKVFRYQEGEWKETTGTMTYTNGQWRITGDVVNPVENYELLAYNAMDWFQGVKSVEDMLAPKSAEDSTPVWLNYFESRYPDNDELNAAYEDGRKVPYWLFKWLEWCEQCNQNLTESDGNIMLDGTSVSGTAANRLLKFKHELHKVANVHSMICYHVFTDYIAAVDQRSKNMMVGFYLDTDGETRMYLNHLYDGDTILGSDNDCGLTIPAELDPNNDPNGYYQGHDSVLFTQIANSDYIWLKDYVSDSDTGDTTRTVTVASIAATMRSIQLTTGLRPFSPDGIRKYWITDRLQKWPKLVSSYDGLRKYIEHSKSNDNYFYALHGLSIQRLEDYVATRFLYRDGFYQCGDTYSSTISMRCTGTDMSVTIKAAKDGFFGIGVDQANTARESVYLKAGETATLHSENTNLGSGVMLYIFGAERIGELDIRNATPKQSGWDISKLTLIKRIIIGGDDYSPATNTGEELSTLNLGQLPFLEELDVRNFPLKNIDARYCPRLKTVLATGTSLTAINLAETSPISTLSLPATMTEIVLNNLPNLTYPGGLTIESMSHVTKVFVNECSHIDAMTLLEQIVEASSITAVRVPDINVTASVEMLNAIMESGAIGLDANGNAYDESGQCSGLIGRWILTELIEDEELESLQNYFKELNIHNAQYTEIVFSDDEDDCDNISNMENKTGHIFSSKFVKSGHFAKIESESHAYRAIYDQASHSMKCRQLKDDDYNYFADGTSIDLSDTSGEGFDIMKRLQPYWYKGVNDYKNQRKHFFGSSLKDKPLSTANKIIRKKLSEILMQNLTSVFLSNNSVGQPLQITENANHNTYSINVEGMKQVRFPGVNSSTVGAAFIDSDNKVIKLFNMYVTHSLFDFIPGEYVFTDVPEGAKQFVFSSQIGFDDQEAISVDSNAIEAIEPDWVHTEDRLCGVYGASVDNLKRIRSISGVKTQVGTGTSTTNSEWDYDDNGKITNTSAPTSTLNYTMKDFQNLAQLRSNGYRLIDYELSKDIANLVMALTGTRDIQALCGYGCNSGYTTGANSLNSYGNQTRIYNGSNIGNLIFGIQNFVGCNYEWMDNVAINVASYQNFLKNKGNSVPDDKVDHVWHIYDPSTATERTVQGINVSGYCIGRVKFGRYADIIPSRLTSDNTYWNKNYSDRFEYSASTCRVPLRSSYGANAYGGLVCASAYCASSSSGTHYGSRLAFIGKIEIEE